jgi:2-keto-3-deoxy-L-rhamnonate aldolase RhmA
MLPYFKTVREVKLFLDYVGGRAKTCLLVETPEAGMLIDEILELPGIDMVHIGLNDMHLALGMKFMFELLADGTVDGLANKLKAKGIPFGFGGLANLEGGAVPGSMILKEHYRMGSSMVIIGRSFCNTDKVTDEEEVRRIFNEGIGKIRSLEVEAANAAHYFSDNHKAVVEAVHKIIN